MEDVIFCLCHNLIRSVIARPTVTVSCVENIVSVPGFLHCRLAVLLIVLKLAQSVAIKIVVTECFVAWIPPAVHLSSTSLLYDKKYSVI